MSERSIIIESKRLAIGAVSALLVLGACSAEDSYDSSTDDFSEVSSEASEKFSAVDQTILGTDDGAAAEESGAMADVADVMAQEAPPGAEQADDAPVVAVERTIIRRATVHLQVEDVLVSSSAAGDVIAGYGGFLFGQETSNVGEARSSITFKVPPEKFQDALDDLAELGFLRDQAVSAEDVTGRVVDLQSQITTAETSVERLRAFLAEAQDLTTITSLEGSLLDREAQLELLRGQLRTIQSQSSLATITVVFTEKVPGPELEVDVTAYLGHDTGSTCVGADELHVDEADLATLCYRLTNVGDTHLADFTLRDTAMKFDLDDFIEVDEGALDKPLAPGEHLTVYVELEADPLKELAQGHVGASPSDELGNRLDIETLSARDEIRIEVEADESLPSFGDGLKGSFAALAVLFSLAQLLFGIFLPFIWVVPLVFFGRRWFNSRREVKRAERAKQLAERAAATPPPVVTPPPPASSVQPAPPAAPGQPHSGD